MILRRRTSRSSGSTEQGKVYYTSVDENAITFDSSVCSPAVLVSNTYSGGVGTLTFDRPVTTMNWFKNKTYLYTITIPKTVTTISSYAFYGCTSLYTVTIEDNSSLNSVGSYAFYNTHIRTIAWNSPTSSTFNIGNSAFDDCTSLTSFSLPNATISVLNNYAFRNCMYLSTFTASFTSSASIGSYVFAGCQSLTEFDVDSAHRSSDGCVLSSGAVIKGFAVKGMTNTVTNMYLIPTANEAATYTYTSIGDGAGYEVWGSLTSSYTCLGIAMNQNIVTIGNYAFAECWYLKYLRLKYAYNSYSSAQDIGSYAFSNCTKLTYVYNVRYAKAIGYGAFQNCTSCSYFAGTSSSTSSYSAGTQAYLYLGCLSSSYSDFDIEGYSFSNTPIKYVIIGNGTYGRCSLGNIESYAFYGCTSLIQFTISSYAYADDGIYVGTYVFDHCNNSLKIYAKSTPTSSEDDVAQAFLNYQYRGAAIAFPVYSGTTLYGYTLYNLS